ncbi:hypothetical protein ACGFX4_15840 [Kitasatospora sp. NPDC048365]|uniref:hypothetical protein n=1 Tax=Kitasatospora sp. NPDC048365 TaxID=3364050 RepID=UPI003723BA21
MTSQELLDDLRAICPPLPPEGSGRAGRDPLLGALGDLVAIHGPADERVRLLLAYGRIFATPRPRTPEALGEAAGLTPAGVGEAFGAGEVCRVGRLTGRWPASAEIDDHHRVSISGEESRRRCTWGGDRTNPCAGEPKYAVVDIRGTQWACCDGHLPGYLRSRPDS